MDSNKFCPGLKKIKKTSPGYSFLPGNEDEMSRRYLMLMQRWIPFVMKHFKEWPDRPDCGHFFGGVYFYGRETMQPLLMLALVTSSPEYDPEITGFPKEHLIQTAVKALRYLCFTHDTGPQNCVRPESEMGYKNLHKTKWGERGRGFFAECQCGFTLPAIVVSALLLQKYLDVETSSMIREICKDYLNRFGAVPSEENETVIWADIFLKRSGAIPPYSGIYNDTQTEENSWSALGMTSSLLFLGMNKQAKNWDEVSKRWMFCTSTMPDDMFNQLPLEENKTANQLCGKIITTLPDFMAENHGIVHPIYMISGITLSGMSSVIYQLFGLEPPPHLRWHRKEIYDALKHLVGAHGFIHSPQGMDWPYIYFGASPALHGYAGIYLGDESAIFMENAALSVEEKILDNNDGHLYSSDVAKYCRNTQDPMIMWECRLGHFYPWIYLAHRLNAKKEYPEIKSFESKNHGVKTFPHSGFVIHRHDKGQTSFSWRNQVMALPWTKNGILTIAPSMGTLLAQVKVKEYAESRKLIHLHVNEHDHGFAALMKHNWSQESVQQDVLFASLPNGNVISMENLTALKECTIEELTQGYLQIMNEKVPGIPACKGFRTFYHSQGKDVFKSFVKGTPDEDVFRHLKNPKWLNIDDEIGIVFSGSAKAVYHNKHYFSPYRAVADDLFLNKDETALRKYSAGETISSLAFLFCPEQSHEKTPGSTFIRGTSENSDTVSFLTDEYLMAGNFNKTGGCFSFEFPRKNIIPILKSASTSIHKDEVIYQVELNGQQGDYFPVETFIETDGENIKATATVSGDIYFTNEGNTPAEIKCNAKEYIIKDGQTTRFSHK